MERRSFLKGAAACGALLVGGLKVPAGPQAAEAQGLAAAFAAEHEEEVFERLFFGLDAQASDAVNLAAPYLATPGQPVMVRADYRRGPAQAIAITAATATHPLVALAVLQHAAGVFATRLRLERTSPVTAYVLTEDGLLSATRLVKVTRGGYGMVLGPLH